MALAHSYSNSPHSTGASPVTSKAAVKSRMGSASQQYQRSQVETASPTRLVIMLYEGAIRFCQLALDAMAAKDLPVQHENLLKAQRIIAELLGSLNREKGSEVADNLARLYTHMLEQLVVANLHDQSGTHPVCAVHAARPVGILGGSGAADGAGNRGRREEEKKRRREARTGNREQGTGNRRQSIGNRQSKIENRKFAAFGESPCLN